MEYNVVRSRRKTLAIYVTESACVEVRAPLTVSAKEIDSFVRRNQSRLEEHIAAKKAKNEQRESFCIDYGSRLLFRGVEYPLMQRDGGKCGFDGSEFYMPRGFGEQEIKQNVIKIYKLLAKKHIASRVAFYADIMGVEPSSVKINSAKTRWGSCSGKNSLNFSWRLIMATDCAIDYVVVHELSHILQHNHSSSFWAQVASVLPDYKLREKQLKELQKRISIEDWD